MPTSTPFQDEPYARGNCCWVCGSENHRGLHIKSHWDGDESVCTWMPEPHFTAGWPNVLNGGVISGLIDCHCVLTAFAAHYRDKPVADRETPAYWFATGSLKVDFLRPAAIDRPVQLRARVVEQFEKKIRLACTLRSGDDECARGEVLAVRVPASMGPGRRAQPGDR